MAELPDALLSQLLDLVDSLRIETGDFAEQAGDQQRWYNRGYANGMVLALRQLGQARRLGDRLPDDAELLQRHDSMPWGKAYRHGQSTGSRETYEITGNHPP